MSFHQVYKPVIVDCVDTFNKPPGSNTPSRKVRLERPDLDSGFRELGKSAGPFIVSQYRNDRIFIQKYIVTLSRQAQACLEIIGLKWRSVNGMQHLL